MYIDEQRSKGVQQWLDTLPTCSQPGWLGHSEVCLAVGAIIVEEMRAAVEQHTGFRCSAGISHNKVLCLFVFFLKEVFIQSILILFNVNFAGIGQAGVRSQQTKSADCASSWIGA